MHKLNMKTTQYTIPAHFACYLIYGDSDTLEPDELEAIQEWEKDNPEIGPCFGVGEIYFSWRNDLSSLGGSFRLGGDVSEFTFQDLSNEFEDEPLIAGQTCYVKLELEYSDGSKKGFKFHSLERAMMFAKKQGKRRANKDRPQSSRYKVV
jgi:hypothetical protein